MHFLSPVTHVLMYLDPQPFEDPDATFIRSVTYRSTDGHRFDAIYKQITDLKKEATKREQQKKEMADVIEQDVLQEVKGRRPQKMPDVFVRPALDGKRLPGEVEIHQNGLRYQSPIGSQKIGGAVLYAVMLENLSASQTFSSPMSSISSFNPVIKSC